MVRRNLSIQKLIARACQDDVAAFGEIYDLFLDKVYHFVYFRVGSREDAEDLTEQIFLKVFKNLKNYHSDGAPFAAWLFRIARNHLTDHYRRRRSQVPLAAAAEVADNQPSPEELTQRQMDQEAVATAIRKLPDNYQEIIILKFIEERENEEISQILQKPVNHVRVLQSRALAKLRQLLNNE